MPQIIYRYAYGSEVGQWTGISYRDENGRPCKRGQIFLGKVIDKEKLIFWKRSEGYYHFNLETQMCESVPHTDLPDCPKEQDHARKSPSVIVEFGDAFFLDTLLDGLQYKEVLKHIKCKNTDTLLAMLSFYTLDCGVACRALPWYRQSFASYLYPAANLHNQRISETLSTIGSPESTRAFLTAHIKYILEHTDSDLSVIIDSTGMPNDCNLPVTRTSVHDGEVNIEFRLIAVVQKSTGLPLYYEYIPGNIIDITTIERTILILEEHNCKVQYCIGDAGYCCPSCMERLCLVGIDFMTRLSPNYLSFKKAFKENKERLFKNENPVRYGKRIVNIVKVKTEIATDRETGKEYVGFIYLCLDHQARASKIDHLLTSPRASLKTAEELVKMEDRLGVFAIVTTRDLPEVEVLPEYYVRQSIEQYFDFAKNYAAFLPVGKHNVNTLQGHLLLSFISSFLFVLIHNRLSTAAKKYVEVLSTTGLDSNKLSVITCNDSQTTERTVTVLEQSIPEGIKNLTARWIFKDMQAQKADVYPNRILPSIPVGPARDIYDVFAIDSPIQINREGTVLKPKYRKKQPKTSCCLTLAFARKLPLTDSEVLSRRQKKSKAVASKEPVQQDTASTAESACSQTTLKPSGKLKEERQTDLENRKTSEIAQTKNATETLPTPLPKRRGRKPGSKDKVKRIRRTKAQIAAARAEEAAAKMNAQLGAPLGA